MLIQHKDDSIKTNYYNMLSVNHEGIGVHRNKVLTKAFDCSIVPKDKVNVRPTALHFKPDRVESWQKGSL